MVNILQRPKSIGELFAEQIGGGFQRGVEGGLSAAHQLGLEKARGRGLAQETKRLEKVMLMEQGLNTLKSMKEIVQRGNIGRGSSLAGLFDGETSKDRAAYEQYGRSLIPIVAAGVPIRNKSEFEEYKKIITDPSSSKAEMMGAIESLEDLFSRSVGEEDGEEDFSSEIMGKTKKKNEEITPESFIDEPSKQEEPSRLRSLFGAASKGLIKGGRAFSPIPSLGAIKPEMAKNLMEQFLPSEEGGIEDILEFTGENIPAVAMGPEGILQKVLAASSGALAKKGAKELGAPEVLQDIVGGVGLNAPSLSKAALSKKLIPSEKQAPIVEYLRNKGFSERQITPIIQNKKKLSYLSKVAFKEAEGSKLVKGIKEGFNEIYDSVRSQGSHKLLGDKGLTNLTNEMQSELSKLSPKAQRLAKQPIEDLFSRPVTFETLAQFQTDINEATRGVKGVKKSIGLLKDKASTAMEHLDPKLAAEDKFVDSMYSRYKAFTEKMTTKDGEKFIKLNKMAPAAAAFMALKFGVLPKLAIAGATVPFTAKEFLTNPRLQRIHAKMWKEFKSGNIKTVEKLFQTLKSEEDEQT